MFRTEPIPVACTEAVNLLGSDTDTIATMAGAIMGAASKVEPDGQLMDRQYIEDETIRLCEIGNGAKQKSFKYPDLMNWRPPKTMIDAVGHTHEGVAVAGLGAARSLGEKWESRGKDSCVWQWLRLSFGQTILAKQRRDLPQLSDQNLPRDKNVEGEKRMTKQGSSVTEQVDLFGQNRVGRTDDTSIRSLDELTNEAIRSGFNPEVIGRHVIELADRPNGIELGLGYVAVIVKAKRARIQAQARREQPVR
jgi:hypothetical protein